MQIQITPEQAAAIRRSILSGSPAKIILTLKKTPAALRTLAERTERNQRQQQPAPPARRVTNILAELAKKAESK